MKAMVLVDRERRIALFFKRTAKECSLIKLASGTLHIERLPETTLWREYREFPYPLTAAVARFEQHGALHGMTQGVRSALARLSESDHGQLALI